MPKFSAEIFPSIPPDHYHVIGQIDNVVGFARIPAVSLVAVLRLRYHNSDSGLLNACHSPSGRVGVSVPERVFDRELAVVSKTKLAPPLA